MGKGKEIPITEFLIEKKSASWADEEQMPEDLYQNHYDSKKSLFQRDNDYSKKTNQIDLPTEKPFATRIYNIPFTWTENNNLLSEFLKDCNIENMYVMKGRLGKSDFAYVSYHDLESLKAALLLNGTKFGSSTLNIRVTNENFTPHTPKTNQPYEQKSSFADKDYNWRSGTRKQPESSQKSGFQQRNIQPRAKGTFVRGFNRTEENHENNKNLNNENKDAETEKKVDDVTEKVATMKIQTEEEEKTPTEQPKAPTNETKTAKNIEFSGRPVLKLKPRSVPKPLNDISDAYKNSENPFGEGKPRDRLDELDLPKKESPKVENETVVEKTTEEKEQVEETEQPKTTEKVSSPVSPNTDKDKFKNYSKSFRGKPRGRGGITGRGRGRGFGRGASRGFGRTADGFDVVNNKKSFKDNKFGSNQKNVKEQEPSAKKEKNSKTETENLFSILSEENE